jgi:hypothetical protein
MRGARFVSQFLFFQGGGGGVGKGGGRKQGGAGPGFKGMGEKFF